MPHLFPGDREQNESNSLIDYFKGQFSILNDVSIDAALDITVKIQIIGTDRPEQTV